MTDAPSFGHVSHLPFLPNSHSDSTGRVRNNAPQNEGRRGASSTPTPSRSVSKGTDRAVRKGTPSVPNKENLSAVQQGGSESSQQRSPVRRQPRGHGETRSGRQTPSTRSRTPPVARASTPGARWGDARRSFEFERTMSGRRTPSVASSRPAPSSRFSGSTAKSGRRGTFQRVASQRSIGGGTTPRAGGTPQEAATPVAIGERPRVYSSSKVEDEVTERSWTQQTVTDAGTENFTVEPLYDDTFSVAADACYTWGCRFIALVLIGCATLCILHAKIRLDDESANSVEALALCALAVLLLCLSIMLLLRLFSPEALRISRVGGAWSVTIHRRGLAPKTRRIKELEAFVETFGYFSQIRVCEWKRKVAGHTTSRHGTVHLFFAASSLSPSLAMTASLLDALSFFTKLRDVMYVTAHGLADVTAEYVADWEHESAGSELDDLGDRSMDDVDAESGEWNDQMYSEDADWNTQQWHGNEADWWPEGDSAWPSDTSTWPEAQSESISQKR